MAAAAGDSWGLQPLVTAGGVIKKKLGKISQCFLFPPRKNAFFLWALIETQCGLEQTFTDTRVAEIQLTRTHR
jgi:hypothetical protein